MEQTELRNSLMLLHSANFAWAIVCCGERELAEEVLQSVYVKVLDCHSAHQGQSSFRTWLFTVIRNAARDQRRKRWWSRVARLNFRELAELPERPCHSSMMDEDEDLIMVRVALYQLPKRQQEVTHLVFYEDLSLEEAAKAMQVTVGTVRRHYARAKESLAVSLKRVWKRRNESISR
jgi:RNA polymerase sigma-70 factor (ECF subfamily)